MRTGGGSDTVSGGRGADWISTGRGRDEIEAVDSWRDRVAAVPPRDDTGADEVDVLIGCESIL